MKKISILLMICCLFACDSLTKEPSQEQYNWEGLRDTLGIDTNCVFIKECSPHYTDDNPYGLQEDCRTKTLFYFTYYNKETEQTDTALYQVLRNNTFIFSGSSEDNYSDRTIKTLIDWIIANRDKL